MIVEDNERLAGLRWQWALVTVIYAVGCWRAMA